MGCGACFRPCSDHVCEVNAAGLGTTLGLRSLTELEFNVFTELNRIRTTPQSYIPLIVNKLQHLEDSTKTFWYSFHEAPLSFFKSPESHSEMVSSDVPLNESSSASVQGVVPTSPPPSYSSAAAADRIGFISPEGRAVYEEAIAFLRTQAPTRPVVDVLLPLSLAALEHMADLGSTGACGHSGSDQSTCGSRISRYVRWRQQCSEVVAYGVNDAREIILQLVVDDGVPERSHRSQLFGPAYTVVGIAIGFHTSWRWVCVIELAVQVEPLSSMDCASDCNRHHRDTVERDVQQHCHRMASRFPEYPFVPRPIHLTSETTFCFCCNWQSVDVIDSGYNAAKERRCMEAGFSKYSLKKTSTSVTLQSCVPMLWADSQHWQPQLQWTPSSPGASTECNECCEKCWGLPGQKDAKVK